MMLTKDDYEKLADKVASSFMRDRSPLNDTILKIADSHEMNPEQIKRLVEMANVKTFLKLFERPENKDSNIEFDVADHADVMRKYYAPKKSISISKVTVTMTPGEGGGGGGDDDSPCHAPAHNPHEFSGDLPLNLMKIIRHGDMPKVAEEVAAPAPKYDRYDLHQKLRKASESFEMQIYEKEHDYIESLEKLSGDFSKLYGPDYDSFERDALLVYGDSAKLLLGDIRNNIRHTSPMPDMSKTAGRVVVDTDTPEFRVFDKMMVCKKDQVKYAQALKLTRQKLKGLV